MFTTVLRSTFNTMRNGSYIMHFDDAEWMHHWYTSQTDVTREESKLTYRVDKSKDAIYLTIVSDKPFPLKNIDRAGMEVVEVKEYDLKPGDVVLFRLFCSPAKTQDNKKRIIHDKSEREEWIRNKLCRCMQDIRIKEDHQSSFVLDKRNKKAGEVTIRVYGWEYQGYARVTDSEALKDLMLSGIGKFKCYGMGQLLCKKAA